MLEFLVALIISSMVAFMLFQSAADSFRFAAVSKNESIAEEMLDVLSEQTFAYGYSELAKFEGSHALLFNKILDSDYGGIVRERPVLLDMAGKTWSDRTISSSKLLDGAATYNVVKGRNDVLGVDLLTITMSVSWTDSSGSRTKTRTLTMYDDGQGG